MINFLRYRKIYFLFSGILVLGNLGCLLIFGLNPGIEFTGGSLLEIKFKEKLPSHQEIRESLGEFDLGSIYIQSSGEKELTLRMEEISEKTHQEILEKLKEKWKIEERSFQLIGPVIGKELKEKTKIIVILAALGIVFYIALAFRRLREPIKSWQYGLASLLALFHDILIPLGIFSLLGRYYGVPITIPIITALLTVLGYSVNNTVVVFDRIRENLLKKRGLTFEEITNQSINQTLIRQINTALTTLFVLFAILFFGGETLRYFTLALILGIGAGVYSSIFLATPILVAWLKWRRKIKKEPF
jgi:preprotein translocase subunit SecF